MLKKRIIPILLWYEGRLVKSDAFNEFREVGDTISCIKIFCAQNADELIILNISPKKDSKVAFLKTVEEVAKVCFVPLSIGGGILSLNDARQIFLSGADKVVIKSALLNDQETVSEISQVYGSQSVIGSLDFSYRTELTDNKKILSLDNLFKCIKQLNELNFGEYFIQDVDRDGKMNGLNKEIILKLSESCKKPLIYAGGTKNLQDLSDGLKISSSGIGCGSIFYFGDSNPIRAANFSRNQGVDIKIV